MKRTTNARIAVEAAAGGPDAVVMAGQGMARAPTPVPSRPAAKAQTVLPPAPHNRKKPEIKNIRPSDAVAQIEQRGFLMKWVKLKKYCEVSGETPDSVKAKRRAGHFIDGIHCKVAGDGNLWINIEEVEKWVEYGNPEAITKLSCRAV